MDSKMRHMKKYNPRRRRSNKALQKQQLKDFEHTLNMDLNTYIVLAKEGNFKQINEAKMKLRSHLLKYGSSMEAIGRDIGEGFPELIANYLKAVKKVLDSTTAQLDDSLLNHHRHCSLELQKKAA